jgi:hypothetical protein
MTIETTYPRFKWIKWNNWMGPNKTAWPHSDSIENKTESVPTAELEKWGHTPPVAGRSAPRMHARRVCPERALGARAAAHNAAERPHAGVRPATEVGA